MKSSQEPSAENPLPEDVNFEQAIAEVERSLQALKARYTQVQRDQQEQAQLRQRQEQVERELQQTQQPALKAELQQIQDRLDELEVNLESQLFSWGSLKESFWQVIRFGGLGVVMGWLLAFAVLQSPRPEPPAPLPNSQHLPK